MDFKFAHNSITVLDLERSIAFYREALGPVSYTHLDVYKRQVLE